MRSVPPDIDDAIFAFQAAIAPNQMAQTARGRALGVQNAPASGHWPLTPCNANPPTGPATLRLTNAVGSARYPISTSTVQIGPQIDIHHQFGIPTFSLTSELDAFDYTLQRDWLAPSNPVSVDFGAPTFPLDFPAEAQLFARDPEEVGLFADTLETDPDTIRAQVATWTHPEWAPDGTTAGFGPNHITLPDALALVSPSLPFNLTSKSYTPDALVGLLKPADFFGSRQPSWTADPRTDFAAGPLGSGSVKAARITYPGLCTLEVLYGRPTPGTAVASGQNTQLVQSGFPSVFAFIEAILQQYVANPSFSDERPCSHFSGLSIDSVVCFPLLRSDRLRGMDAITDARGQIFLSIRMSGYTSSGQCVTQASALYDIKLDARGALVIELAGKPILDVDNPHGRPFDVTFDLQGRSPGWASGLTRPDVFLEDRAVDWNWISTAGHVQSGVAAFRLVDTGGYLCNAWAPAWAVGGPVPFPAGLNNVVAELMLHVLPQNLNAAFRGIQMFPRAGDPAPSGAWACDPVTSSNDPQGNLRGARKTFFPTVPLDEQEQLGFGFINATNAHAKENCLGARSDFCNAVRHGFYAMNNLAKPSAACLNSQSCCAPIPTDPLELQFLLQAVNATDAFGNLAHWGCVELDPGNSDCIGSDDPRLLDCSEVDPILHTPTCNPIPDPNTAGSFLTCAARGLGLNCLSRNPSITSPPDWKKPKWSGLGDRFYGCQPNVRAGACYFLPPARRLIANPDGIQLVFYDNEHDCVSAALALRYAVLGYNLPMGATVAFPNFNFPSPDYLAGDDITNVDYLGGAGFQGRWRPAYQVANHPMAICNYTRFNDLGPPTGVAPEGGAGRTLIDAHGHPWRPYTFPRSFAVYSPNVHTSAWRCPP